MSYPLTAAQSLRGDVTVPGDKSISHRAVMFGALADADTHITGFLMGEDCLSTISCFKKMGVSIDVSEKEVVVHGVGCTVSRRRMNCCTPAIPAQPPVCCAAFSPVSRFLPR